MPKKNRIILNKNKSNTNKKIKNNIKKCADYLLNLCQVKDINTYECIFFDNSTNMFYNIMLDIIFSFFIVRNSIPTILVDASINPIYYNILKILSSQNKIFLQVFYSNCQGMILPKTIKKYLNENIQSKNNISIAIMSFINGDTGSINQIQEIGSLLRNNGIPLLCDCDNIFGIADINIVSNCIDMMLVDYNNVNYNNINHNDVNHNNLSFAIINKDLINTNYVNNPYYYNHYNICESLHSSITYNISVTKNKYKNRKDKNISIYKKRQYIINELKKINEVIDIKTYMILYKKYKESIDENDTDITNNIENESDDDINFYKNYFVIFGPDFIKKTFYISNILLFTFVPAIKKSKINISKYSRNYSYKYFLNKNIEIDFNKNKFDMYSQLPHSLQQCPIPNMLKNNLIKIYINDSTTNKEIIYFVERYIKYIKNM